MCFSWITEFPSIVSLMSLVTMNWASHLPPDQRVIDFYKAYIGKEQFEEVLLKSLHFLSRSPMAKQISTLGPSLLCMIYTLYPLRNKVTHTLSSHLSYYEVFAGSPVSQPYFSASVMIALSFRFFFSLKVTRVFGPFTKLLKIYSVSLLLWLAMCYVSPYFLFKQLCPTVWATRYLVLFLLMAVRFEHLGSEWSGFLLFGVLPSYSVLCWWATTTEISLI